MTVGYTTTWSFGIESGAERRYPRKRLRGKDSALALRDEANRMNGSLGMHAQEQAAACERIGHDRPNSHTNTTTTTILRHFSSPVL